MGMRGKGLLTFGISTAVGALGMWIAGTMGCLGDINGSDSYGNNSANNSYQDNAPVVVVNQPTDSAIDNPTDSNPHANLSILDNIADRYGKVITEDVMSEPLTAKDVQIYEPSMPSFLEDAIWDVLNLSKLEIPASEPLYVEHEIAGAAGNEIDSRKVQYKTIETFVRASLNKFPETLVPKHFIELYFDEFFSSYYEFLSKHQTNADGNICMPNIVIVTNKSLFRTDYFDLTNINLNAADSDTNTNNPGCGLDEGISPQKTYKVAVGKQDGDKRTIAGYNPNDRVTPEGIFWVDLITDKPEDVFSNGKYLGPRAISTMAPSQRSPKDDIVFHGTLPNVQWTIGMPKSFGCLRMYNKDVTDLYERLNNSPCKGIGAIVIITP